MASEGIFTSQLQATIEKAQLLAQNLPEDRISILNELAAHCRQIQKEDLPINLTFICTHNSRRSHLAQIWAATAAHHYGIQNVHTFSGGTEATAFNPRAIAAIERAGFLVNNQGSGNPKVEVRWNTDAEAMVCFSKKYDDPHNPQQGFVAVMTCSQADEACPLVKGANYRVAIPYIDPKIADGTAEEAKTYDERSLQIAAEMLYLFAQMKPAK